MKTNHIQHWIRYLFDRELFLCIAVLFVVWCPTVQAQDTDSVTTGDAERTVFLSPPSTGSSEKIQGGVLMAVGGVTALAGIINMNVEDPCDDVADSPFTECISNADGVRTVGVIGTGVGASLAVVGALRYLQGVNRAQTYREWRRAPEHSEQETPSNEITDSASGSRGGFLIGFGAGPGLTSFQLSGDAFGERVSLERTSKASLMTDFKIGYAPSDLLAVYWMSKVAWGRFGNGDDPPLITNGFGGLGASYRIQRDGDPLFLNGGLGFSTWASPTDPDTDAMFGPGFVIGSELEFAKNWVVDADLMWGRPSRDAFRYSTLGLKLTVNYLHY